MTDLVRPGGATDPVPDADSEGALSLLLDVLLEKGVYLDLDLVITVAEVPLIAVNLRATIAGVETMLEWGVPGVWDDTVADRPRPVPVTARPPDRPAVAGPEAVTEMAAAMRETRAGSTIWRDGTLLVRDDGMVQWRGSGDRRPRLSFAVADLEEVAVTDEDAWPARGGVVLLRLADGRVERIAAERAGEIPGILAGPRAASRRRTMEAEELA